MKFLRSLFRKKPAEPEAAAPKKEPPRAAYRSPFRPGAGGDGFEAGARKPVDLTGGMKVQFAPSEEEVAETAPAPESDFSASLEDLGALMEGRELPVDPPDPTGFTADPLDVFEPTDPFQPIDSFESAPVSEVEAPAQFTQVEGGPLADLEVSAPEVEPPAEIEVAPPLAPIPVEPAASPATTAPDPVVAQHTVALLIPIERQRTVEPRAIEQFSTLDLMDIVEQLRTDEEPVKVEETPAPSPEPLPLADGTPKE